MIEQNENKSNKRQEDFVQRHQNDPGGLPGRWGGATLRCLPCQSFRVCAQTWTVGRATRSERRGTVKW